MIKIKHEVMHATDTRTRRALDSDPKAAQVQKMLE